MSKAEGKARLALKRPSVQEPSPAVQEPSPAVQEPSPEGEGALARRQCGGSAVAPQVMMGDGGGLRACEPALRASVPTQESRLGLSGTLLYLMYLRTCQRP